MDIAYPHIAERLFGRPHAIEPAALRIIVDGPIARRVLAGERIDAKKGKKGRELRHERLSAIAGAEQVRSQDGMVDYALTPEGVAILSISGVLSRRFDWLAAACGWTTYEGIGATLAAIKSDFRVRAVMLDVDSPGGEVSGMLDVADAIVAARGAKPIWAVANTLAASAAYALAGGADKFYLPRLAQVGSIGCVMMHVDQSVRDEAMGLAYTAIYSGARKIDGWGHAPLSDEARAAAQASVDHVRDEFAALVARQGRMSAKAALATEAAVYSDDDAVKAGLVDGVMTFDDALAELVAQLGEGSMSTRQAALSSTSPAAVALASAHADKTAREAPDAAATEAAATAAAAAAATQTAAAEAARVAAVASAAMTPPVPGEKCELCGETKPSNGPEDDDEEKVKKSAARIVELCTIAGMPAKTAQEFMSKGLSVKQVRTELLKRAALASDAAEIVAAAAPAGNAEAAVAAQWDEIVTKQNEKLGFKR